MQENRRRYWRCAVGILAATVVVGVLGVTLAFQHIPFDPDQLVQPVALQVTDSHGQLLRFLPDKNGERHQSVGLEELPDHLVAAFLAAEDERFFSHWGVDFGAVGRAIYSNLRQQRVVSGASTLTMQLVRYAYGARRSYGRKLAEVVRAIKAERLLTKQQILAAYLNRVPQGNNIVGVSLAAEVYFGKPVQLLTPEQSAVLAALPKAPTTLNPYGTNRQRLKHRRDWVLSRMVASGALTEQQGQAALATEMEFQPFDFPFEAGHFVDYLLNEGPAQAPQAVPPGDVSRLRTTLDLPLQKTAEAILQSHQHALRRRGAHQACALVVDNREAAVRAWVGSIEYSAKWLGFNDGLCALRSPGSALKPFLYGTGFEKGVVTPATVLEDVERRYRGVDGDYLPLNFNRVEYGPINVRSALGNSLNLSAVVMIKRLGHGLFYDFLSQIQLVNFPQLGADYYGLGMAIGSLEVTPLQLFTAYTMLARGGVYSPLRLREGDSLSDQRLISEASAFLISDILSDPNARLLTFGGAHHLRFPYRVAFKTGTSTKHRDAWIVGYTPEYTVGVWCGNFSGRPTAGITGGSNAGPIFRDLMDVLYREKVPGQFLPPEGVVRARVCSHSGCIPTEHCPNTTEEWFLEGHTPNSVCLVHQSDSPYHEVGPAFARWIDQSGRSNSNPTYSLADPASSPAADSLLHNPSWIEVVYPLHGDRFVYTPGLPGQEIEFQANPSRVVEEITWYLNGEVVARTGPPYNARWNLAYGAYELMALTPDGNGDVVQFVVE